MTEPGRSRIFRSLNGLTLLALVCARLMGAGLSGMVPGTILPLTGGSTRGAVAMWVTPTQDVVDPRFGVQTLFAAAGKTSSPVSVYLGPVGLVREDVGDRPLLRFAAAGFTHKMMAPERVEFWHKGEPHHVVVNWDATTGDLSCSIDGTIMPFLDTSNSAKLYLKSSWQAEPSSMLIIGAADTAGKDPWKGRIQGVKVFDHPLTAGEAWTEFGRAGLFRVEARTLDAFFFVGRQERLRLVLRNQSDQTVSFTPRITEAAPFDPVTIDPGQSVTVETHLQLATPGPHTFHLQLGDDTRLIDVTGIDPASRRASVFSDKLQLVADVDAVARAPLGESAPSRIVGSPLGPYRESGEKRHDRFALDFTVHDVGQPHLAVIEYPDDKPRTMEALLQPLGASGVPGNYQAQTGVLCGAEYPLSQTFQEHRVVFWPQANRMSFIFMTGEDGRPAAVRRIRVYRFENGLSRLETEPAPGGGRHIGIYYEDPVLSKSFNGGAMMPGFEKTVSELLDYMDWSGQDILNYPLVWYSGPLYGSLVEPFEADISSRPHPYDYPRYLMKRLESRGMKFNAGMHIHNLAGLVPDVLTDIPRILAGEETPLNMQANNKPKTEGFHGQDTSFNPLDPRVQQGVNAIIREIAERYGDEPSFTGITLVTARQKLFSFNSLDSGYNDSNIREFENETGVAIPVEKDDPERFSKAHEWLIDNRREEWIGWRCRKIHDWYREMADILSSKRADLKLTVNLFPHQNLYGRRLTDYLKEPDVFREIVRETGIDIRLFSSDKNIRVGNTIVPADSRWLRSRPWVGVTGEEARTAAYAPELAVPLRDLPGGASLTIHDRYFEDAVGREHPLKGLGVPEHGWRVSTLNPSQVNGLEEYVMPLANFDALGIVKGGFVLGTLGLEPGLAGFARQFRAIPNVPFDDVPGLADPVRVRQKVVDGKAYFYVLNTLPAKAQLTLNLVGESDLELSLRPYELRTFARNSARPWVSGGHVTVDPAFVAGLERKLRQAEKTAEPSPYLDYARKCWSDERYARLFRLLQEPWNQVAQ